MVAPDLLMSSTGCTCYLHRCISSFDSLAGSEVNMQHYTNDINFVILDLSLSPLSLHTYIHTNAYFTFFFHASYRKVIQRKRKVSTFELFHSCFRNIRSFQRELVKFFDYQTICLVCWGWRMRRLHPCRGVKPI